MRTRSPWRLNNTAELKAKQIKTNTKRTTAVMKKYVVPRTTASGFLVMQFSYMREKKRKIP